MDSTSTALLDRWTVAEAEMTLAMQHLFAVRRPGAGTAEPTLGIVSGASRDHVVRRTVETCRTALQAAEHARHAWEEWEDALPRLRFARWRYQRGHISG